MDQTEDSSYKVLAFAGFSAIGKYAESSSFPGMCSYLFVGDPEGGQFSAVHMILVVQHLSLP